MTLRGTHVASHICQFDHVTLICNVDKIKKEDVRIAMQRDDFLCVCLSDDARLEHFDSFFLLQIQSVRKAWEHADSAILMRNVFCCGTVFRVGKDQLDSLWTLNLT